MPFSNHPYHTDTNQTMQVKRDLFEKYIQTDQNIIHTKKL